MEEGYDVRAEFLSKAGSDTWVNWPDSLRGDPADEGEPCARVADRSRQAAITRLAQHPAIRVEGEEYERLTGAAAPTGGGAFYLLRGFSTTNSSARVKVNGNAIVVQSDGLGGLWGLRRHPCIAALARAPSAVYTIAVYDL